MRHAKIGVALLVVLAFCVACPPSATKKTSVWMNEMYTSQFDEYMTWFEKDPDKPQEEWKVLDNVTEEQKKTLRIKKRILTELHPLIDAYAIYATTSESPEGFDMSIVEKRIIELINRLMQLTMKEE